MEYSALQRRLGAGLGLAAAAAGIVSAPFEALAADSSLAYRQKVIGVAGIMDNVSMDLSGIVTRGEFAAMLVKASTYKDYVPKAGSVSVFSDVPAGHVYASSIRIAADEDWMQGYLGGSFKPEQPVTMKEAVRAALALLGYVDETGAAKPSAERMALFYSLEMNENLDLKEDEVLTREDCVNLFYNLLKTENQSGQVYAEVLGCEVNADGEINPMELADSDLTGPKLVRKGGELGDHVPFNVREASVFINGDPATYESLKTRISEDYVVIYYNTTAKTIWAYTTDEDAETGRCAIRGEVEHIYYSSADVMTPTTVILDNGEEYRLESSEMQFAFSVYGSLRVGDTVTLICEKTTGADGEDVYTVVDYVED